MDTARTDDRLRRLVEEFRLVGIPVGRRLRVVSDHDSEDPDSGLIVLDRDDGRMGIYVRRERDGWIATVEPRGHELDLSAHVLAAAASDFAGLSALVEFLNARTSPA